MLGMGHLSVGVEIGYARLDSYSCLAFSRLFRSLRLLWICYVLILSFLVINK